MKLFGGGKPEKSGKHDEPVSNKHAASKNDEAGYFDSPTETVSLAAPLAREAPAPVVRREEPPATVDYGINSAIQLMRSLPADHPELVVTVIKTTLESLRVKVADIIADAARKQADLENRVQTLSKEISDYEREIQRRKDEIGRLEADHAETTSVKERLELAEKSTKPQAQTGS